MAQRAPSFPHLSFSCSLNLLSVQSLTIPFIAPAATPFFFSYVRPRAALLALVLGVQVRSMIISHIEGADQSAKKRAEKGGPVKKSGKVTKK
jgi:hypothetical protein